jgi:hypothetical protein
MKPIVVEKRVYMAGRMRQDGNEPPIASFRELAVPAVGRFSDILLFRTV